MAVDGVVNDVDFSAHKPLVEGGLAAIQHFVPFSEPIQVSGLFGPETLPVGDGALVKFVILLDIGRVHYLWRRIEDVGFHPGRFVVACIGHWTASS